MSLFIICTFSSFKSCPQASLLCSCFNLLQLAHLFLGVSASSCLKPCSFPHSTWTSSAVILSWHQPVSPLCPLRVSFHSLIHQLSGCLDLAQIMCLLQLTGLHSEKAGLKKRVEIKTTTKEQTRHYVPLCQSKLLWAKCSIFKSKRYPISYETKAETHRTTSQRPEPENVWHVALSDYQDF